MIFELVFTYQDDHIYNINRVKIWNTNSKKKGLHRKKIHNKTTRFGRMKPTKVFKTPNK